MAPSGRNKKKKKSGLISILKSPFLVGFSVSNIRWGHLQTLYWGWRAPEAFAAQFFNENCKRGP